jgi:acyl-CoA thioester hydrolase
VKEQTRQSVTDGHFVWPVRVYYEDTDSGGVVYYANYLRFMERARTEWLRSLGFEQDVLVREAGVIFAVRSAALEYLRPARFNDLLQVDSRIAEVGRASLTFEQSIVRRKEPAVPLCTGRIRVACVSADALRPRPIPPEILAEISGDR